MSDETTSQTTTSRHELAGLVIAYFADRCQVGRAEREWELLSACNAIIAEEIESNPKPEFGKSYCTQVAPHQVETPPEMALQRIESLQKIATPFEQASKIIGDECEAAKADMRAKGEISRTVYIDLSEVDTGGIQIEDPIRLDIRLGISAWSFCIIESGHWGPTLSIEQRLDIAGLKPPNPLARFLIEFLERYA